MTTQIKAGVIAANAITASELASSALSGGSFTGDVTFDTDTLVVDSANNRVGIGTTSPSVLLDVSGATPTIRAVGTSASNPSLTLSSAGITAWSQTVSGSDSSLSFNKDGSEKMRIDTSGNVGIGQPNPSTKLDVTGFQRNTLGAVFQGSSNLASGAGLEVGYNTGGSYSFMQSFDRTGSAYRGIRIIGSQIDFDIANDVKATIDSSGNVGIGGTPTNGGVSTAANPALQIIGTVPELNFVDTSVGADDWFIRTSDGLGFGNSTTRVTFDNSGNVGIGNANPSDKLHIQGTDASTTDTLGLRITNFSTATNSIAGILFQNYDNHSAWIRSPRSGSTAGILTFGTNAATGTAESNIQERMRIDSSGNLLVGTTSNSRGGRAVINGSAGDILKLSGGASGYLGLYITQNQANNHIYCDNLSTAQFYVTTNTGDYYFSGGSLSDRDLKENITSVPDGSLDLVKALTPRTFNFKAEENFSTNTKTGFIAQEVAEVITEGNVATGTDGQKDMAVDTTGIVAHLVKAIQEQQTIIDDLKSRLDSAGL